MSDIENGFDNLDSMTTVEKQALCYRLLVERDKINERLRLVQLALKKEE